MDQSSIIQDKDGYNLKLLGQMQAAYVQLNDERSYFAASLWVYSVCLYSLGLLGINGLTS